MRIFYLNYNNNMAVVFVKSGMAWALLLACSLSASAGDSTPDYFRWGTCIVRKYPNPWYVEHGVWFNNSDPKELDLQNCNIKEIKNSEYNDVPNVIKINLQDNDITQVDTAAFKSVSKLKELILSKNFLREAPVFDDSAPNLIKLALNRNLINGIYNSRTFYECRELEELDLSGNFIEYIHWDVFSNLHNLKRLYLHSNRLSSVPTLPFCLTELWLNHNRFKHLPSNFLSRNCREDGLLFFFGNNPWHCACLLELLADVKRVGVRYYGNHNNVTHAPYDGARLECLFLTGGKCDMYRNSPF